MQEALGTIAMMLTAFLLVTIFIIQKEPEPENTGKEIAYERALEFRKSL